MNQLSTTLCTQSTTPFSVVCLLYWVALILSSSAFSSSTHKVLVPPINISIVMMHVQGFIHRILCWGAGTWGTIDHS